MSVRAMMRDGQEVAGLLSGAWWEGCWWCRIWLDQVEVKPDFTRIEAG